MASPGGKAISVLAASAVALFLSGCANKHLYPGDRRPDDQVAYIEAERLLMAGVTYRIDGVAVGSLTQYYLPQGLPDDWLPGAPTVGASVLPGRHGLAAHVARYGWVTTARTDCASMTFDAAAGARYRLFTDSGDLIMRDVRSGAEVARTSFSTCRDAASTAAR